MSLFFQEVMPAADLAKATETDHVAAGGLRIDVPHWATRIDVYDDQFAPVPIHSPDGQTGQMPRRFATTRPLEGGIYVVEATLAGHTRRLEIPVTPGVVTTVGPSHWASLTVHSAAPLDGSETADPTHAAVAEEWSRKPIWLDARGDSRLFLFVRTTGAEKHRAFWGGLKLLDPTGRLVADLSANCKHEARQGWAAFNAALPSGGYVIRRGGNNVPLRFQSIFLVPGWTTQIFLEAGRYPRLHTMAVNLVAGDRGFHAADHALEAAEVLLQGRRQPAISDVAADPYVRQFLEESPHPWLGIVAAHALLTPTTTPDGEPDGAEPDALPGYVSAAIDLVAEHPDARALALQAGRVAGEPFWFPPLLRASLKRVAHHWDRHPATVPENSLTDLVLDSAFSGSPWTAWKTLVQLPSAVPASPATRGRSLFFTTPVAHENLAISALSAELAGLASPAAPAYYLATRPQASDEQVAELLLYLVRQAANPQADQSSPIVQLGHEIMRPGGARIVPFSVTVVRDESDPLDAVTAEDISATTGVPRQRAERGLERLRQTQTAERASGAGTRRPAFKASRTDQVVMRAALKHASGGATRSTRISLEEAISQLRAAARVIDAAVAKPAKATAAVDADQTRALAQRLNGMANALLASAGFSVVADAEGRIVFGNGAFRDLLLQSRPHDPAPAGSSRRGKPGHNGRRRAWEQALAHTTPRTHTLPSPVPNSLSREWALQRTDVAEAMASGVAMTLYVLRISAAPRVSKDVLAELSPLLRRLSQYAPLFAYGVSATDRQNSLQQIADLVPACEKLVGVTGRA